MFIQIQPPLLFSDSEPEAKKTATPKVLAIDGFWEKRYNAASDGEIESTVPIILTVGSKTKAFSSGSVNGGGRCQLLTNQLPIS